MRNYDDYVIASLLEESVVSGEDLDRAKHHAASEGTSTLLAIESLGIASSRDIALMSATIAEYPFVDITRFEINFGHTKLLPRSVAERHRAFPLFRIEGCTTVGMVDPLDLDAVDQIRSLIGGDIEPVLCESDALGALIQRAYSLAGSTDNQSDSDDEHESLTSGEEPIVAAVNHILASAAEKGVSDIHLSPDEHNLHLRFRIDGILQPQQGPALSAHPSLVRRVKVMANLDLTQSRRPQDGKFRFVHNGRPIDVRVSLLPTVCGENVVMRLLEAHASVRGFAELGMLDAEISIVERMIDHPHGMVLVTGPTGSGKTTTLYAALSSMNEPHRNIMTIEDPVELRVPGIRQTQVHASIGMTFAGALRSVLRQDPDIILVGEIRDEETARIAVQSALTGHLVLSTLHTNDAPGAIARLHDLGVAPFAINAALLGVVAQRLVRRTCDNCASPEMPDEMLATRIGLQLDRTYLTPKGCGRCSGTGYRGRCGVYEMLEMTRGLRATIDAGVTPTRVRNAAVANGMLSMADAGLRLIEMGLTTPEEVARVVALEEEEGETLECDVLEAA